MVTKQQRQYDFIIVGGGIAGLSLAYHLINSPFSSQKILIIDQSAKDRNDRTLSFWTDEPTHFDEIVYHSWNQIRFVSEDFARDIDLGEFSYKTIRGIDFYKFVLDKLAEHPTVTFQKGRVQNIKNLNDGAMVLLDQEVYFGRWVFDSRLKPYEFKHEPTFGRQVLRQFFKGWMLRTTEDVFDPTSATLFDFRIPQDGDMRFFYLLPFSPREALVEYVGLKHADYDEIMQQYVEGILGIKNYETEAFEGGAIILTDHRFRRRRGKRVLAIGSAGGMVKPSSGYAFTRIQNDCDAIINSLTVKGHPFDVPGVKPFYYVLDSLMIEAMNRFAGKMKKVFTGMFKDNPAQRIFRFLDEEASPLEVAAMVVSMPAKHIFIWSIFTDDKRKSKTVTG